MFRRDDDVWSLVFDGAEARMPDAKGLHDLHTLLANPRVEVAATALATGSLVGGAATPVLDAQAKQAYRRRLDELDSALDRAGLRGDAGAGGQARTRAAGPPGRAPPGCRSQRSRPVHQR